MDSTEFEKELTQERRGRLAAERMLEHKQAELQAANRQLSEHALALAGQIVDQREVVSSLKGENSKVTEDLERANTRVVAAERLLWAALEHIPDGFALFGPDFRLIAANGPYLGVFEGTGGVEPGCSYQSILDVCLDEGLVDLLGEEEDTWYDRMLDRWGNTEISPITLRFWNGMHVKMVDRRTADGGVVSLALNITDSILREEELRGARDKAQAADRAKSAFLAKMSHELRTPMNGVVGMASLLLEQGLDKEAQLYSETIRNSGEALLTIINDILDFSRIEADRLELKAETFDLPQLASDVLALFQPGLRDRPIVLQLDYASNIATKFLGDAGRLRQILVNLVGNAVKFTEAGHILLRITGEGRSEVGPIHISVEDTGLGVPVMMQEHIFGEFNQIEDGENRQSEGTGLGLAITRKLIEAMGGTLWIDSIEGHGSVFGFALDLPKDGVTPNEGLDLPVGVTCALLWIENGVDLAIIERALTSFGLDVTMATDASAFGLAVERRVPDFVVCSQSVANAVAELLPVKPDAIPFLTIEDQSAAEADIPRPYLCGALLSKIRTFKSTSNTTSGPPLQVLAAEDNKTNQLVLSKMLSGLNIDLTMASDGEEALAHYNNSTPDLIFLDISMPKMDGMEVARTIRTLETGDQHVPIVAMTAHAMSGDEERIRASGIDHYLTKPLRKADLHRHVNAVSAASITPRQIAR